MSIQLAFTVFGKENLTSCEVFVYMYVGAGRVSRLRLRIVDLLYVYSFHSRKRAPKCRFCLLARADKGVRAQLDIIMLNVSPSCGHQSPLSFLAVAAQRSWHDRRALML